MQPYIRKVRYWDVDSNAHVFNPRYFVYFDDALTDFFDETGLDFGALGGDGPVWVVARAECDFEGEATIGDVLVTTVSVETMGNTSVVFGFETNNIDSEDPVATGREVYVLIDRVTRRPIRVPDEVRELLLPHLTDR